MRGTRQSLEIFIKYSTKCLSKSDLAMDFFKITPRCHSGGDKQVPRLSGRVSGDLILFVSSKQRRLEARNFAVILMFVPFTIYEKISFIQNKLVGALRMAFQAQEVFGTFEKRAPGLEKVLVNNSPATVYDRSSISSWNTIWNDRGGYMEIRQQ